MKVEKSKSAEAQMLIRKPVAEVFNAFIDPYVTTQFWFTQSTGKLETGKQVIWSWEMYGVSSVVVPIVIKENELITVEWGSPATTVDFNFKPMGGDATYVEIQNYGFNQTGDELIAAIKDSTGGFTTVLDGLKAWLEYGIHLNLVEDKFPQGK
ncbi:SRPBCC family protein [Mucilaginibacter sp. 3215]|uniref:SRPBCC family protein n=1 Tax=Mucilaginibacter sp. 3215 TaxID=3373912 RepID=UPI003D1ECE92